MNNNKLEFFKSSSLRVFKHAHDRRCGLPLYDFPPYDLPPYDLPLYDLLLYDLAYAITVYRALRLIQPCRAPVLYRPSLLVQRLILTGVEVCVDWRGCVKKSGGSRGEGLGRGFGEMGWGRWGGGEMGWGRWGEGWGRNGSGRGGKDLNWGDQLNVELEGSADEPGIYELGEGKGVEGGGGGGEAYAVVIDPM
ncbi:hypothetical protein GG344DRAFT_70395 [Lentinula edodes]|nr:hypothetical protein GG344DRAFT_70395 [Lentinula edodes]